jgi:hypothetical protein
MPSLHTCSRQLPFQGKRHLNRSCSGETFSCNMQRGAVTGHVPLNRGRRRLRACIHAGLAQAMQLDVFFITTWVRAALATRHLHDRRKETEGSCSSLILKSTSSIIGPQLQTQT